MTENKTELTHMYNCSADTIPLTLPVHLQVLLQPWFEKSILQEGLDLIRNEKISDFFFYRHAAAGLLDGRSPIHILFSSVQTIRQGFTLQEHRCTFCGPRKREEKRCPHLAALTILSLMARENNERDLFPLPLYFSKTGWSSIENFLYDWLSHQKGRVTSNLDTTEKYKRFQISKEHEQEGIWVDLPAVMEGQWKAFFSENIESDREKSLCSLREEVQKLTFTKNETQMFNEGCATRGSKRDASVWSWICRDFAIRAGNTVPALQYDDEKQMLTLMMEQNGAKLTIRPPVKRTWELLSSLREHGLNMTTLPTAQECFQVKFLSSGEILVIPSVRMEDKTTLAISELNGLKTGSCYFLPETGFLPVKKQTGKGIIRHPDSMGQGNLFDFAARSSKQTEEFTVNSNLIPEFRQLNSEALKHPTNKVDSEILEMKTVSLPEKLVIEAFEEDQDWCYLSCHYGMGNSTISLSDLLEAGRTKADFIPGKEWLHLSDSPLSWFYDLLPERLTGSKNGTEQVLRLRHSELMALTSLIPEISNKVKQKSFRKKLGALLDCDSWSNGSLLRDCPDHLRSYQRNGMAWLKSLYRFSLGGLLADDMGLGKTHQGLALLDAVGRESEKKSAQLIICPASVLYHWKNKIDTFYPDLQYTIHYGPDRLLDTTVNPGLLITTYTIARIDQDLLAAIPFDIILLDEIQHLKNRKTALHHAVATLNARVKIGLTGTPIENSLTDLHSLFSICLPGFFSDQKKFIRDFLVPIKEHKNKKIEERLRRLIQPFILRRNRQQVLTELPDLSIDDRTCELSDTQVKLYRDIVDESHEILDDLEQEESSIRYINLLAMLTRLKQVCDHPCLLKGCRDSDKYESGKWNLFVELLLDCLAADLKVVVFSQYTGMLDIIEDYLERTAVGYARLRGDMPVTAREKMIQKFSDDKKCRVFCASLLAGGTGIDLIAAQVVIHYDRWWNPAKEAQATARVHRMGQTRKVQVFRLITTGTLEEKIHTLLKEKQEISDSLISEDEGGVIKKLDRRHLKALFRLDQPQTIP